MGTIESKVKRYSDIFTPLRICSFYVDIDLSINKRLQINSIIDYYMKGYHNYELDILCLQGIRKYNILKEIIWRFKKKVRHYNEVKNKGYDSAIYLEYFPDIDMEQYNDDLDDHDDTEIDWSDDENDNGRYYDKLIISRYPILHSTNEPFNRNINSRDINSRDINSRDINIRDINIRDIDSRNINIRDTTHSSTLNNSELMSPNSDYIQVVNFNIDGTHLSIYNVELKDDNIGTNNTRERKRQLYEIRRIIDRVREDSKEKKMRIYEQGDDRYVAYNRDIHIVTGMFHINDTKNDRSNSEYMKTLCILKAFDVHPWIKMLKKDLSVSISNVRFTKDSYILMCTENFNSKNDVSSISYKMYQYHKLIIINATIPTNLIDVGIFTNYPLDAIFMIFRPKPKPYDSEKDNHTDDDRNRIKSSAGVPNERTDNQKDELTDNQKDERTDNQKDERTDNQKDNQKDERTDNQKDNQKDERVDNQKDEWVDNQKDDQKDERVDNQKDDWVDNQKDERTDKQKDERTDKQKDKLRDERGDERKDDMTEGDSMMDNMMDDSPNSIELECITKIYNKHASFTDVDWVEH